MSPPKREAALYPPVKAYLEAQGYRVMGEVGACDVLARRGTEPPIAVELKLGLTLTLIYQGIARQALVEAVYLAIPAPKRPSKDALGLCRRLGLGLLSVDLERGQVTAALDPGPYRPRKAPAARRARLLREFETRVGDPNAGGSPASTRMTAYRQDALRCARHLEQAGPTRAAVLARETGVGRAARILLANHYGWFDRVARGIYALSPAGKAALRTFHATVLALDAATPPPPLPAPDRPG